jgi:hypothetical protein
LIILEKLMQYCIPKQQSISVEAQIQAEYAALEKLLNTASDAALEQIAANDFDNRLIMSINNL